MEEVRSFLESSTIHGLAYIPTGRKYVRLSWIIVVIAGFTGAIFMINESFKSWNDNPIKTTIDTRPIKEMTLPKVTAIVRSRQFSKYLFIRHRDNVLKH